MRIFRQFILDRIVNRFRQYGIRAAVVQLAKAAIRQFYQENRDLVFLLPDFNGYSFHDPCISRLSRERIEKALLSGEIEYAQAKLMNDFLDEGSIGLYAEVEEKLVGHAWVQLAGEYNFGRTGHLVLPSRCVLFKYLFVYPEYRGMRLGQKLNAARLSVVPPGHTPVVFIIPDNRYAIRNWERFGFQRVIEVRRWRWGQNGKWRVRLTKLENLPEATPVMHALEDSVDA